MQQEYFVTPTFKQLIDELMRPPTLSPARILGTERQQHTEEIFNSTLLKVKQREQYITESFRKADLRKANLISVGIQKPQVSQVSQVSQLPQLPRPAQPRQTQPIAISDLDTMSTEAIQAIQEFSPVTELPVSQFLECARDASEDPYVALTAAVVQHVKEFKFLPTALFVPAAKMDAYLNAIERVEVDERDPRGVFVFRGHAIRLLTDRDMPRWLKIKMRLKSMGSELDLIYSAA